MIIVVADTSGLLAALDSSHPDHRGAGEALIAAGLLVMSPLLLAELDHVATRELGRDAATGAVDDIRRWVRLSRVVLPEITETHLAVAQSVRARYSSLDLDLADAVNVALAAEYDTDAILTLDRRDFRAIRPVGRHKSFRLLPDDLPL
ncbi:PIN domain-containing protein [Streptomyces albidoflavus]|uniref:Ribonuclease VapC n=1 Tax=Streptomyces wadayamensis TaxID=141454 RepID=A0ABR4SC70_9ACTN|nr:MULTISPECIES: PIN domain-containing protein [Streptomyces]KDR62780.1 twitching motility protein PilT [Streptomyces wadayamensis]QXQ25695.1 PIN domain-containing protein [Streptomyces albidoflavus]QXQ31624.1 PIN domain-containing protein [Streptomyces albidoflavus]RZE57758.1 PIN domain-containing protein [Streptomyces albidoflavus]RZE62891.1 PIN domain-containing protein [Streptomyces albidoflavus]